MVTGIKEKTHLRESGERYTGYVPLTVSKVTDRAGGTIRDAQSIARSYFSDRKDNDWFSGPACSDLIYFATDGPGLLRNNFTARREFLNQPTPQAYNALGMLSGLLVISGGATINRGCAMYKSSKKVDCLSGKIASAITAVRGAFEGMGGLTIVPLKIMQLLPQTIQKTSAVSKAIFIVGTFATLGFAFLYLLIMVPVMIQTGRSIQVKQAFKKELAAAGTPLEQLRALKNRMRLTPKDVDKIEEKLFGKDGISKEQLRKMDVPNDAYSMIKDPKLRSKIINIVHRRASDCAEFDEKLYNLFALEMIKTVSRKKLEMSGTLGPTNLEWLSSEMQTDRVEKALICGDKAALAEWAERLPKIQTSMNKILALNFVVITFCAISTVTMILLQFAAAHVQVIAQAIMGFVSLVWTLVDGYFLKQAFDSGYKADFKQQVMLTVISLLMISVLVVSAVYAAGPFQIAVIAGSTAMSVGLMSYVQYKWNPIFGRDKNKEEAVESEEAIAKRKKEELLRLIKV